MTSNHKKYSALITGATGFVGSHLVRRLVQDGWNVHILSRKSSNIPALQEFSGVKNHLVENSIEPFMDALAETKPDVVFHLASLFLAQHSANDISNLISSNLLFGTNLLEAMKANNIKRIINTGTSWQHYNNEDYNPVCLYAATKQAFESIIEYYVKAYELQVITLKLFDTYGQNDSRTKLFQLLNKASKSGNTLDMSNGEQLIDIVHIDDVVEAYLIAAKRLLNEKVSNSESYAVSSENPLTLRELVKKYSQLTNQKILINWGGRPYRYREVMTPWKNGKKITGWKPKIDLNEGILALTDSKDYSQNSR